MGGVGIGIASVAAPIYIAEIAPAEIRGRMVAINQIAIVGGIATTQRRDGRNYFGSNSVSCSDPSVFASLLSDYAALR